MAVRFGSRTFAVPAAAVMAGRPGGARGCWPARCRLRRRRWDYSICRKAQHAT
jgi:hypothetical protein